MEARPNRLDELIQDPKSVPLKTLPIEVHAIIASYLPQRSDLSKLCRTCKSLRFVFQQYLYSKVVLRVPIQWSRLASLEDLLSSSGDGLQFTTTIVVSTQQRQLKHDQRAEDDDLSQENMDLLNPIVFPSRSASNALNMLVRLLILKLPRDRLRDFLWNHNANLESATLDTLLTYQGASLQKLALESSSPPCSRAYTSAEGLVTVRIGSLDSEVSKDWPGAIIAKNYKTLRNLGLGRRNKIAKNYVRIDDAVSYAKETTTLLGTIEESMTALDVDPEHLLSLNRLDLYGLDFSVAITGVTRRIVDFNHLQHLVLESCSGLSHAFHLLAQAPQEPHTVQILKPKLKLRSLVLRHEKADSLFQIQLEEFLCSLPGLHSLCVLLEGTTHARSLGPILKTHGKSLRTLIWDERFSPRATTIADSSIIPFALGHLGTIAKNCPKLVALGIALNLDSITSTEKYHDKIASCFKRMSKLETFNIRTMPKAESARSWLPLDMMYKGLAQLFMDIAMSKLRHPEASRRLKTIAFGAATYADINIGANYHKSDIDMFLQLRIYHVEYRYTYYGALSSVVDQVAKGTVGDAVGLCGHLNIFNIYWLR